MKEYAARTCPICGMEYIPKRIDQKNCLKPSCQKGWRIIRDANYRESHRFIINKRNSEHMKRKRLEEKMKEARKRDTIVAIGYADRQREQTLKMVGGVNTEL